MARHVVAVVAVFHVAGHPVHLVKDGRAFGMLDAGARALRAVLAILRGA